MVLSTSDEILGRSSDPKEVYYICNKKALPAMNRGSTVFIVVFNIENCVWIAYYRIILLATRLLVIPNSVTILVFSLGFSCLRETSYSVERRLLSSSNYTHRRLLSAGIAYTIYRLSRCMPWSVILRQFTTALVPSTMQWGVRWLDRADKLVRIDESTDVYIELRI